MDKRCAVYDLIVDGDVVYVGCSVNPERRLRQHRKARPEFATATMRVVRWYSCQIQAKYHEGRRIRKLCPNGNGYGNWKAAVDRQKARVYELCDEYHAKMQEPGADRRKLFREYERRVGYVMQRSSVRH